MGCCALSLGWVFGRPAGLLSASSACASATASRTVLCYGGSTLSCACVPPSCRSRELERGPRFSNRSEDLRVTQDVEDLFTEAARVLARTTRRYPVNISSINDIMRHRDRCVWRAVHALVGLPAV
jgi:hypothetical protein